MTRLRHAGAVTFLVYVVLTLLAVVPTLPVVMSLGGIDVPRSPGGGALLELLEEGAPALAAGTIAGMALGGVLLVLSPFLQMTWLAGLERPRSVAGALAVGATRYLPAIAVTLWMLLPLAIVAVALVAFPVIAHLALASHPNDQLHDLVVLAAASPGAVLLVVWCAWHDLARAALASGAHRARTAVRRGWRTLGARTVAAYVAWALLAAALALLGHSLGLELDGPAWWRGALVLVALQLLALARVLCRGAWLGIALDSVVGR